MSLNIREFKNDKVATSANVEAEWDVPAGAAYIEINLRTAENSRFAFDEGETADGQSYHGFNPDWWTPQIPVKYGPDRKMYFRTPSDNVVEIVYGVT